MFLCKTKPMIFLIILVLGSEKNEKANDISDMFGFWVQKT